MSEHHQRLVVLWTGGSPLGKPDSVRIVLSGSQGSPEQLAGDRPDRVWYDPEGWFVGGAEGREFPIGFTGPRQMEDLWVLWSLGQGARDALDAIVSAEFCGLGIGDTSVPEILTEEERDLGAQFDSSFARDLAGPDPEELERQIAFIRGSFPGHTVAIECAAQAALGWVLAHADEIRARAQVTAEEVRRKTDEQFSRSAEEMRGWTETMSG